MTKSILRSIRFSDEEWGAIQKQAEKEGRTPTNLVYWATMKYIREKRDEDNKRSRMYQMQQANQRGDLYR